MSLTEIGAGHALHLLSNVARAQNCRVAGLIRRVEHSWVPTREGAVRRMSEFSWLIDTDDRAEAPHAAR